MTLKNNRAPLLCFFKLYASFRSHRWIQTGVTVRKRPIWVKIDNFFSRVTLQFDVWPWKTIGHLFYATSSFVHHFVANRWFQTWVTVRKRLIWVKIRDVLYRVTLKFDGWPWKTIGHLSFAVSSFVQHFIAIGEFKLELQSGNAHLGQIRRFLEPCDLEIWRMTLKNNRASLLCYFKLYASFRSHWWIQAGVTVRKQRTVWVKIDDFFSRVTLQFDVWPWKTIGHLFYATSSFVHHFVAIGDLKLELQSGNAQFGSNLTIFRAVWPCNLTYDLEKQ